MENENWWMMQGDCRSVLADCPDDHFHAILTDPPYGLSKEPKATAVLEAWLAGREYERKGAKGFCGETWDGFVPGPTYWKEMYRVLAPGGHLLSFGGPRTWDWLSLALRLSGFENRDTIADFIGPSAVAWVYGQGMGKGERLKPAWEPILVFRKPTSLPDYKQMQLTGTAQLNIDACRLPRDPEDISGWHKTGADGSEGFAGSDSFRIRAMAAEEIVERCAESRYPPNVVLTEDAAEEMDRQSGLRKSGFIKAGTARSNREDYAGPMPAKTLKDTYGDVGGASRYFPCFSYTPKPTRAEKELGCEEAGLPIRVLRRVNPGGLEREKRFAPVEVRNAHKCVKPISLLRYLVKLVSRPGQIILDPFMGSGSTGAAAVLEGRQFVGIELNQEDTNVAQARIRYWEAKTRSTNDLRSGRGV